MLQYDPRDLTISVEAGISYRELSRVLAEHRQMIPLDPPFSEHSTIGGVVAANVSGPRRRLYGSARDMVIGMTFATLEGKLVRSGGMVVKNVAGLDMAKLMIGSFGTLAAIAVVNFRLHPMPAGDANFCQEFDGVESTMAARNQVLQSRLQPAAIDILKTAAGYQLLMQAGGSPAVLDRYSRELAGARGDGRAQEKACGRKFANSRRRFLAANEDGAVVRVSVPLSEVGAVLIACRLLRWLVQGRAFVTVISLARAIYGSPVGRSVIEFAAQAVREGRELWPQPGSDFEMMKKVKEMFDPQALLNRGRLYGRI